jgi:hypothetical protein
MEMRVALSNPDIVLFAESKFYKEKKGSMRSNRPTARANQPIK